MKFRWITKTLNVALAGIICGAGGVFAYNTAMPYLTGAAFAAPWASFGNQMVAPAKELIIPKIKVDAPIISVGIDNLGNLGVPSDAIHVAWYKYGPRPGMAGTAVIDGHLDTKYVAQAVFYNLSKLKPGDEVDIRTTDNKTLVFKVTNVKEYLINTSSTKDIFASSGTASGLNLITCAGDWLPDKKSYNERLVVFTKRVK